MILAVPFDEARQPDIDRRRRFVAEIAAGRLDVGIRRLDVARLHRLEIDLGLFADRLLDKADELIGDDAENAAQKRRARQQLLVTGLEILATWYADAASIQLGGPIRNRDLAAADLTAISPRRAVRNAERILDAVTDLRANLRPQLLLTSLFASLGSREG